MEIFQCSPLCCAIWNSWFKIKDRLVLVGQVKEIVGIQRWDLIWWWPTIKISPISPNEEKEALSLQKMGLSMWSDLWDKSTNDWITKVDQIAKLGLSKIHLDIIIHHILLDSKSNIGGTGIMSNAILMVC